MADGKIYGSENRRRLYDNLSKDGFDLGTFEDFNRNMDDKNIRRSIHTAAQEAGWELPEFNQFERDMTVRRMNIGGQSQEVDHATYDDFMRRHPSGRNNEPKRMVAKMQQPVMIAPSEPSPSKKAPALQPSWVDRDGRVHYEQPVKTDTKDYQLGTPFMPSDQMTAAQRDEAYRLNDYAVKQVDKLHRDREDEEKRRQHPIVDTGSKEANKYVVKKQGQWERELEKGVSELGDIVAPMVSDALKKADERWFNVMEQAGKEFAYPGKEIADLKRANEAIDPDKILKGLQQSLEQAYNLPEMQAEIEKRANAAGIPKDEYLETIVAPSLEQQLAGEFASSQVAKYMPKNATEYILQGLGNSVLGMLGAAATETKSQRAYKNEAEALTESGGNKYYQPGTGAELAKMGVTFAADAPFFGISGRVGGRVAKKVVERQIQDIMAKGLSESAARSIVGTALENSVGARMKNYLMQHVVSSSITMGGFNAMSESARQIRDREFNPGQIISSTAEGLAIGGAFGLTGGAVQALSQPLSGIARVGAKVAGFGAEAETMYATEELAKMAHGEAGFENPFEGSVESLMKLGVMKASTPGGLMKGIGEIIHPVKSNQRQRTGVQFSKEEEAYILESAEGKSLLDALSGLHPEIAIGEVNGKKRLTAEGAQMRRQLASSYDAFMSNPDIPATTKQKVAGVLGGIYRPGLETGADIVHNADGSIIVKTRDKDGNCVRDLMFNSFSDAEQWREDCQDEFRLNDAVNMWNGTGVEQRMAIVEEVAETFGVDTDEASKIVTRALDVSDTSLEPEQFDAVYDIVGSNAYPADEYNPQRRYEEGKNIPLEERHFAMVDAQVAEERLLQYGEEFAEEVISNAEYADEKVSELASRKDVSGEQLAAAVEYYNASSKLKGLMDETLKGVDEQVEAANAEIRRNTHPDSGALISGTHDGRNFYVTAGHFEVTPDGRLKPTDESGAVIVRDVNTGEIEVLNPQDVTVSAINDPVRLMEANDSMEGLRGRLMKAADDSIELNPQTPETPQEMGETFMGADGKTYMVTGEPDELGNVVWEKLELDENGDPVGEPQPLDIDEYRKAKSDEIDFDGRRETAAAEPQPAESLEQEPAGEPAGTVAGDVPENAETGTEQGGIDSAGGEAGAEEAGGSEPPATTLRIPVDENGRQQFEKAKPEDTLTELTEKYGEEKAGRMIATLAENTARAYEELSRKDTSKMTDMAELAAHEDELAEAARKRDYWAQFEKPEKPAEEPTQLMEGQINGQKPQLDTELEDTQQPESQQEGKGKETETSESALTEQASVASQEPAAPAAEKPAEHQLPVQPQQPTAEQKIAGGSVKANLGKTFEYRYDDGSRTEMRLENISPGGRAVVTQTDYDAQGNRIGEPQRKVYNATDIGGSIIDGTMKPVLSTEEKLRVAYKGKVGMQNVIDVLTEAEQEKMLRAYEKGDNEALSDMIHEFTESHREDIILNERDKRNANISQIMEGSGSREDKLRRVRKQYQGYDDAVLALSDEAMQPTTLEEYVAYLHSRQPKSGEGPIAYFSYDRDGTKVVGMQDETGYGTKTGGDTKGFAPWLAPKGKGMSLQKYAEQIHGQLPESIQQQYSDQDVRNAILEVFGGAERPSDITTMVIKRGIIQAEQAARRMEDMWIEGGPSFHRVSIDDNTFAGRLERAKQQTNAEPTERQKEAGNYKKGHVSFGGYDFVIENPEGSMRRGRDAGGNAWEQRMHNTYGYILGKNGKDGDHLDMFINDQADLDTWNGNVYVVDQVNADGSFDESKIMYGFGSEAEARKAYLSNYKEGWQGLGRITGVDKDTFDKWLDSSTRQMKPFAEHSIPKGALKQEIQGLEGYSKEDILGMVRADIETKLEEAGVEGIEIKGMDIHGSRMRGDARSDSDIDIVVEYVGRMSEDGLFNILNEEPLSIEGVTVDINPITEGKSGTLEQYMERSRTYDEELAKHHSPSPAERETVLMDAVVGRMKEAGIDVSTDWEEGQRVLDEYNGSQELKPMGQKTNKKKAQVAADLEGKELTPEQQAVVDVYSGKKDNQSFVVSRDDGDHRIIMRQGNESHAGTKHSLFRHYGTNVGTVSSDELLLIPEIAGNGELTPKQEGKRRLMVYKSVKDGVEYTLLTEKKEGKEVFNDFYSNRKASSPASFNTPEGARSTRDDASKDRQSRSSTPSEEARAIDTDNALSGAKVQQNSETDKDSEEKIDFHKVTATNTLDELEKGPTVKRYRAMQLIDGKLYPPMSAKVDGEMREPTEIGVWEQSEERPDLIKNGKFVLNKGQKGQGNVPAAYNPYFHTSTSGLNDQFTSAYKRPELVVVEVEIPESELSSGYKAEGAKDAVGDVPWHSGVVNGQLPADRQRQVTLSRYSKVTRIVPDSEVADMIAKQLEGTNVEVPYNVVTPAQRAELEKRGVKISATPAGSVTEDINGNPIKKASLKQFKTSDGHAYGFTYRGKIYIDPRIATAETPIHEYGHLWAEMKRRTSPEEWDNIKQVMLTDKLVQPIIERVKRDYPELAKEGKEDDFIEEIITQFSGKRGAERLREIAQEIAAENGGVFGKAEAVTAMQRLKNILNRFWEGVAKMMSWKYTNANQIADRIMADMLNGVNPVEETRKSGGEGKVRPQKEDADAHHKESQLDIISRTNPMTDDYHTGIRSVDDIRTFEEAYEEGRKASEEGGWDEYASYPDITNELIEDARKSGKITIYSSYPIKDGTFVTPSMMQARDYAGEGRVYSKRVPLEDVAWINLDEGQYAKVGKVKPQKEDTAARDKEYADAVAAGDMEKVDAMLREEAARKGYSEDSSYQGSIAFNGAAPSRNGYFETREERKEAMENGTFEDTFSLGDYAEASIDANDLEWQLANPIPASAGDKATLESIRNLNAAIKGKTGKVKMYRAVDAAFKENSFRNGDWVTPSRKYAEQHIGLQDWKKGRIIEEEVPIDDIWWNGDDINEWGYDDGKGYAYKNAKNNRKLMEPTYDDDGNLIPLSKRFNDRKADIRFQKKPHEYPINEKEGFNKDEFDKFRADAIGKSVDKEECIKLLHTLKNSAEDMPEKVEFTEENYNRLFGNGIETPVGHVKMSDNQKQKMSDKSREGHMALAKRTLEAPDMIIRKASEAKEGQETERPFSYIFVKTFKDAEGKLVTYFFSVSVKKDGMEVSVSNYIPGENQVKRDLREGTLAYIKKVTLPSESGTSTQGDQSTSPAGEISSGGKDTKKSDTLQEKGEKNAEILREGEAATIALNGTRNLTPKQMRSRQAFAERQWRRAHEQADEWVKRLRLSDDVTVVDSIDELEGSAKFPARKRNAKGWYNPETGKIVIVMGNHRSPTDVVKTILHEGVAHHGLRKLFGENFDTFLDNAYSSSNESIRQEIDEIAKQYNGDTNKATEEYLGRLAEDTDFEDAEKKPWVKHWFNQIKEAFLNMLKELGLPGYDKYFVSLSDNELRYILWRSYKNLSEPGRYRNVFDVEYDKVAKEVKMPVPQHIEDHIPKMVRNHDDEVAIKKKVSEMTLAEAQAAYKRIDDSMRDENGLDLDEQFEANKQSYMKKNGLNGIGQFVASDLQRAMDKYGSGMVELRWALQDRILDLGGSYAREGNELFRDGDEPKYQLESHPEPEMTPEERQYWMKWDAAMKKWKERNAIAADADGPGAKPQFRQGESALDFAKRIIEYKRQEKTWQTAPKLEDYRQKRLDKDILEQARDEEKRYPDSQAAKMRRVAAEMQQIRHAISQQKAYDKATVKAVTDFAQDFMKMGFGDNLSRGEMERMLSSVKNATGAKDIRQSLDNIMNILTDNYLRNLDQQVQKLSSVKELRQTAQGVEAQGRLELKGQRMIQAFREAREGRMDAEKIRERLYGVAEKMARNDDEAPMWEQDYEGLSIALQYQENIEASRDEYAALDREYKDAVKDYKGSGRSYKDQQQLLESLEQAMMENKIERIGMFGDIIGRLQGNISESMQGAKEFVEREKERVKKIQQIANFDLAGKPADTLRKKKNGKPANFFLQPLGTFEQMLKRFGGRNANGEGYLYDYFMRSWMDATDKAYLGEKKAKEELDAKAREVFGRPEADASGVVGGKVKRWSDLYDITRKLPTLEVRMLDGEEPRVFTLNQGNLLYVYMADKMTDGRMKLRKMGIDEETVEKVKDFLDPRLVQLGDWLQDDYLVQKRIEYNKVHERMFGAPMAAIDHYFPLKILGDARYQEQDVSNMADQDAVLPSTITGNIIKRRKNALPLDILHTDALSLAIEHMEDMERWAATAEWNKDINTLLSYTTFRNKVKNMKTIYGSGDALWNTFADTARMAAGTYRPKVKPGSVDSAISNIAKGVTAAKINFRVYTAFKQLLSAPAFLHDVNIGDFVKDSVNPYGSWKWAMENMPVFRKRWKSRQVGDTRLMDDPTDWKMWKTNLVQMATRIGMSPNALVDGVTCAVGARAIYQSRYKKYKSIGASDELARKRALQDAEIGYNLTQQSSEGAFVSAIQKDRTVAANMLSVFRNSSMAYTRQWVDAARNLKHRTQKGYKEDSISFMTKQMQQQFGLNEGQAQKAAEAEYARAGRRDVARMLNMMFGVTVAWNLGASLPYLLMGDDDKTKKEMLTDAMLRGLIAGPTEGFATGNLFSEFISRSFASEETRKVFRNEGWGSSVNAALKQGGDYEVNPLPLMADIQGMIKKMGYDKYAAAQDVFNICMQSAVGVNPQTFTDMWNAIMDYAAPGWDGVSYGGDNDMANAKELALFIMRLMNAPTSSWKNKYIDELGMDAEDAKKLSYDEMARRYAHYKHWKDAPIMGWLRGEEGRQAKIEKLQKQFDKAVKERLSRADYEALQHELGSTGDEGMKKVVLSEMKKQVTTLTDKDVLYRQKASENAAERKMLQGEVKKRAKAAVAGIPVEALADSINSTPSLERKNGFISEYAKRQGTQDYYGKSNSNRIYQEMRTFEDVREDINLSELYKRVKESGDKKSKKAIDKLRSKITKQKNALGDDEEANEEIMRDIRQWRKEALEIALRAETDAKK